MELVFYRFSTAGNTTLFVEQECDLKAALQAIPAEQAGIAEINTCTLTMGGGELCINASLAFAALLSLSSKPCAYINTAGLSLPIKINGQTPFWDACLDLETSHAAARVYKDHKIIEWPGIIHAFIACKSFPSPANCIKEARILLKKINLLSAPAAGVTWWIKGEDYFEIRPAIHVPALSTFFLEGACGSASASLAFLLGEGWYRIRQYSGQMLNILNNGESLKIEAPVQLLAKGTLWL